VENTIQLNDDSLKSLDMDLSPMDEILNNAKKASKFLKSLANDNRLVIVCALSDGEKNVGELEEILGIRQPTLSQQLARLRADEIVSTRRESKQIYYSLASKEAERVIRMLCIPKRARKMGDADLAD